MGADQATTFLQPMRNRRVRRPWKCVQWRKGIFVELRVVILCSLLNIWNLLWRWRCHWVCCCQNVWAHGYNKVGSLVLYIQATVLKEPSKSPQRHLWHWYRRNRSGRWDSGQDLDFVFKPIIVKCPKFLSSLSHILGRKIRESCCGVSVHAVGVPGMYLHH